MDCPTVLEKLEKIIEIKEINEKAIILERKIASINYVTYI